MKNMIWAPKRQHLLDRLWILKAADKLRQSGLERVALRLQRGPLVTQQAWDPSCLEVTF